MSQGKKIVPVLQQAHNDCGHCCLLMVLTYLGIQSTLREINLRAPLRPDGSTAYDLVAACNDFGAYARGVDISYADADSMLCPAIVHWKGTHFVLLEAIDDNCAQLVDPRCGHLSVSWPDFMSSTTGVAIVFE